MAINCHVILQWTATPEELTAFGAALWRWCIRAAGNAGIYQYLDSQELADLMAGKFPLSSQSPPHDDQKGFHFRVRDEASNDRQATIASLRRSIPAIGVIDIVVDGVSWNGPTKRQLVGSVQ